MEGGGARQMESMGSDPNQLDEPVWETLKRDLVAIAVKTRHVVLPNGKGAAALRDWDLWGPLLMCFLLAVIVSLSVSATPNGNNIERNVMFAVMFIVVTGGSLVVTFNAKVLGGQVSIFQAICVLGYCMFPLVLVALIVALVALTGFNNILFRGLFILGAFVWSSFACLGFMTALVDPSRKLLSVYPVLLFYLILAWLVLIVVK